MKMLFFILMVSVAIIGGFGFFFFIFGDGESIDLELKDSVAQKLDMQKGLGDNWIIEGDRVYIEDENASISITPHTLLQSGEVTINLTSKVYEGDVDLVFGVNSDIIKPKRARILAPHQVNHTRSFTCPTEVFNYTLTPTKHAWCWLNESIVDGDNETIGEKHTLYFEHDFESGDIPSKTIYWTESEIVDWRTVTGGIEAVNYDFGGMNKWYYAKNVPIKANKSYIAVIDMSVLPTSGNTGKYWFAIKPSSETIEEAIANQHFYAIDPWWNSTFGRKRELNISGADTELTNFTAHVKVDYDTDMQSDFDDLRFVDSSETVELDYEIAFTNSTQADVWIRIPTLATAGTTVYMYYNNSEVTDGSDFYDTWADALVVAHLDETSVTSTDVPDSAGLNDNGTRLGEHTWTNGRIGYAAALNASGVADWIKVNDTSALSALTDYTVSFWLNVTADGAGSYHRLVQKGVGTYPTVEWIFSKYEDNHWDFQTWKEAVGAQTITTGYTPAWSQWYHVILGVNESGGAMFLYVNGVSNGTLDVANIIRDTVQNITMGARDDGLEPFTGQIDEFRYWNTTFTEDYLERIYENADSTTWSFGDEQELDGTPPDINITYPENMTYAEVSVLNYTYSDINVGHCWYSNDTGQANSSHVAAGTNFTIPAVAGNNSWSLYCNDSVGNVNSSIVEFYVDSINPDINITYPENLTYESVTVLNYTYSEVNIGHCWYSNDTGQVNSSTVTAGTNFTIIGIEGNNSWSLYCNDSIGNENSSTIEFNIDSTNPDINITYPENLTYESVTVLNYTYSDLNLGYCWYSNDTGQANSTEVTAGTNFTIIGIEGNNSWSLYCNDSIGNENSSTIEFNIDDTPPTFDNLRNFIHQLNNSFGEYITASDASGIDNYRLNDTTLISINTTSGYMTNATNLSTEYKFYLNITANDTLHNLISGIFYINVTFNAYEAFRVYPHINKSVPYVRVGKNMKFK